MLKQLNIKLSFLFPLILLLINFVSKGLFLTSQEIGLDEPFTIYHAQFGFSDIIEQLKNYNNPPLFELVLHVWIKVFGISVLSVRMLPFIFACLCPLALYYFAKRHFSISVAVFSSLLLSFSELLLYYSHDCRVYSLFLLLSILSMHFFLVLLESNNQRKSSIIFFIVWSVLLIYAHYFGFFVLFIQGLYLLLCLRTHLKKLIIAYGAILLLYLPHLYPLINRAEGSVKNGTWIKPPNGIESLYNMLWTFSNFPFITVACIVLLVIGLFAGIKNIGFLNTNKKLVLLLLWFLIPFLGMFFMSYAVPMYISRYLIYGLPAYYFLLVICVQKLIKSKELQTGISVVLILCFAFTINYNPDKKQHGAEITQIIKQLKTKRTLVIVSPQHFLPTFAYHYNKKFFMAIEDKREYDLMDSLLRNDNLVVTNTADIWTIDKKRKYDLILYACIGDDCSLTNNPIMTFLNRTNKFMISKKIHDNYGLSVFRVIK
jgi:mannosyltransferase